MNISQKEDKKNLIINKEINLAHTSARYAVFILSCIYTLGVYVSDDLPAILEIQTK
jgi:hypothetical protein